MFGKFFSKDYSRRRALAKASGPLQDFLATPFPGHQELCHDIEVVALDFETTGLNPRKDSILSVGMVDIKRMAVQLDTAWHQLISVDHAISEESVVIHEITDDQAAEGRPIDEVLPEILKRLAGRVMLVHYKNIEQNFLDVACRRLYGARFVVETIDTLDLAARVYERLNHTIQTGDLRLFNLRPRYNLPRYKAHNALTDAVATAELFLAMAAEMAPPEDCRLGPFLN